MNERTVVAYVESQGLPAHKIGPRDWRFDKGEVLAWLRGRSRKNEGKDAG